MGRKYAIRDQEQFYFVTFTAVYWLDIITTKVLSETLKPAKGIACTVLYATDENEALHKPS